MTSELAQILLLFALLQIKHMFADYYMQTPKMLGDRGVYWHPGRAQHCGVHVVGTGIALLVLGVPFGLILAIVAVEFVVHFHIDFGKGRWSEQKQHGPTDASYWRAFGFDQTLHQLSYVALVWAVVVYAG